MKTKLVAAFLSLAVAATAEFSEDFESGTNGWFITSPDVSLNIETNGGYPGAFCEGSESVGTNWYFATPTNWAGNWSEYKLIKWDLKLTGGGYADSETNDVLILKSADGIEISWNGPSPIWEWSHFEVVLEPAFFGVDSDTFEQVITNVQNALFLGNYKSGTESTGLDSVEITTNQTVHTTLQSTFDTDDEDWRPYDDVTLTWKPTGGNPGGYLFGDDWADGRTYRFATPLSWAGDWRAFNKLSFDLKFFSGSSTATEDVVTIRGANGRSMSWQAKAPTSSWTHYEIGLYPASFGVDQSTFDGIMAHVTEMLILGEYVYGDESEGLDNVILSSDAPNIIVSDLISTFDADLENWRGDGDISMSWSSNSGNTGGCYLGTDLGQGPVWYYVTPENWSGDWRQLEWLRFQAKSFSGGWSSQSMDLIWIKGWNGIDLVWNGHIPHRLWTPFSIPLTPESFNTDTNTFLSVMANVKGLWIRGEVASGSSDQCLLDNFELLVNPPSNPLPARSTTFDADAEGWWHGDTGIALSWIETGGNPGGYLQGTDGGTEDYWHYHSPETWIGDWRHYSRVSFDHKIISGTAATTWNQDTFQIRGANNQTLGWQGPLSSNAWTHFEVELSPSLFGVTQQEYDAVMANVVALRIRGEYVSGGEIEGLDNVMLHAGPLMPVISLTPLNGTNLVLAFTSQNNVQYQLEQNTNLVTGSWEPVPGELISGDGTAQAFNLTATGTVENLFFRIQATAP